LKNEYLRNFNEKNLLKNLEYQNKFNELGKINKNADNYQRFSDQLKHTESVTRNQLANNYETSIRDKLRRCKLERYDDLHHGNNMIQNAHLSLQFEKNLRNQKLQAYRLAFKEG